MFKRSPQGLLFRVKRDIIQIEMKQIIIISILAAVVLLFLFYARGDSFNSGTSPLNPIAPSSTPTPTPVVLKEALPKDAYTIIMVGDSMTESLGPNSDKLREYLKINYPTKIFGIYNLAKGSTSILSLQEILDKDVIKSREFEVILIESFGYNPLSDLSLEAGLKKQTETLDKAVNSIRNVKTNSEVNSIIVFVATIAPNREKYGQGAVDLSPEKRAEWADERTAYIKNHMEYARENNIPLINVYDKSLNKEGTGDLEYIEGGTFIHPSKKGIELISKEIADFLLNSKILPE